MDGWSGSLGQAGLLQWFFSGFSDINQNDFFRPWFIAVSNYG